MTAIVKKNALFVSGFFLFVITRIIYLLCYKGVTDPYGYFKKAMIRAQDRQVSLTSSGIALAYTGSLSKLFMFVGNRMDAVVWFHFVLQTAAFVLIVCGCTLLFGRMAACVSCFMMTVMPYLIISIGQISPDNYLLLYLSLLFFLTSVFYKITKDRGWYRNIRGELYLTLLVFSLGMVCFRQGMWQDVSARFLLSAGGVILMSGLFGFFGKKKQEEEDIFAEEIKEEKNGEDEQKPQINYIENPLPLPKKHVKKTMSFDLEQEQDDFDFEIDAKDDFDV